MNRFLIATTVITGCFAWFLHNDSKLPKGAGAQKLEFVRDPDKARETAAKYGIDDRKRIRRALLVDSAIFVPAYVVALSEGAGRAWAPAIIAAGVLDLLENGGIALEVHKERYDLAPFVASAAAVKWLIVVAAIGTTIARYVTPQP